MLRCAKTRSENPRRVERASKKIRAAANLSRSPKCISGSRTNQNDLRSNQLHCPGSTWIYAFQTRRQGLEPKWVRYPGTRHHAKQLTITYSLPWRIDVSFLHCYGCKKIWGNFRRKLVNLRRTPFLKINNFRRNIGEIEAHSFFENGHFSTTSGEIEAHSSFENEHS